ncbi:hypothetical protein KR054_009151 [Drosophila jambulina]|nr:hypothetical protein KR054_009151 [Drosophila jambulina]
MIPCKPKPSMVGPKGLIVRERFVRHPVVISAKRFAAIKGRSRQDAVHHQIEAVEEERRYRQYLKEGNDLLCSYFTDPTMPADQMVRRITSTEIVSPIKEVSTAVADERLRKQRIIRANNILNRMKPGPRALNQALLLSEMIHQRKYNEDLNKEIAEAARAQEKADEELCPEALIPFEHVTEEEEKAKEAEKKQAYATFIRQDIAEREKLREAEKEQRIYEEQVDRAQYKCLQDKEEKALKEKKAKKIAFYRQAYRDAIQEKAEIAAHEKICDKIDDRRNCVYIVAARNLDTRYGAHVKAMRQKEHEMRAALALRVSQAQGVAKQLLADKQATAEDRYEFETQVDENRRQCEREVLATKRRAYQLEEKEQKEQKYRMERELQRFQVACRLKNAEANRYFDASQKRKQDKVKQDLRNVLFGQREEFLEKRRAELMNLAACNEDPYLAEDKKFYEDAVEIMEKSRKVGRPLYPIANAVKRYEKENQLDMQPEGRMVKRSQLRDSCWPGFYSKAELAYRKYEQREMCREEQQVDRHQIMCNSVKIKKLAELEKPYKPCLASCPINCFHRRGVPATDSQDNFDYDKYVCYEDPPTVRACPGPMQVVHNDPLNNTRRISQPTITLPPMPDIPNRNLPAKTKEKFRNTVENMIEKNKSMERLSAKQSQTSLRGTLPPAAPTEGKSSLSKEQPSKTTKADPPAASAEATKPPKAPVPLPKSQPPQRRPTAARIRRGSDTQKPVAAPLTGNDRLAPIPNPKGTWGDGPLPVLPKKKKLK